MRLRIKKLTRMLGLVAAAAVTLTATAVAQEAPAPQPRLKDPAYVAARERLADVLTSESIEQVDFHATTFDGAMNLIYRVADTFLNGAEARFPDLGTAADYGVSVIEGLDKHRITPTVKTLVGGDHMVIVADADAETLGQLVLATATIIRRIDEGGSVHLSVRDTATRIFNSFLYDSEVGVPLVQQYLVQVRELAQRPLDELVRYAK